MSVVIAILAKDKSHCLDLYLDCIYNQSYPRHKIHLYIRTNNNNDNTPEVLKKWIDSVKSEYASVYYDDQDVPVNIQQYKPHEWNADRFRVLGSIRQDSIDYAKKISAHYLVVDCDNFIKPHTLDRMISSDKEIIGPLLPKHGDYYSNFHHCVDDNGYYLDCDDYYSILEGDNPGLHPVDVVHCTYFIHKDTVTKLTNNMFTEHHVDHRHEYVIFSENVRSLHIQQWIDNTVDYGFLTMADDIQQLQSDPYYCNWI